MWFMVKKWCLIICILLLPVLAFAQTAAELDTILETKAVSAATAARFALGSADLLPQELSGSKAEVAAYDMAKSKGWITTGSGEDITLKDTAFLIMSAFDVKGGVMYKFLPGPRYAYREMVYRKLIQGRADPDMNVSGARLLQIIGRTLDYVGTLESGGDQ